MTHHPPGTQGAGLGTGEGRAEAEPRGQHTASSPAGHSPAGRQTGARAVMGGGGKLSASVTKDATKTPRRLKSYFCQAAEWAPAARGATRARSSSAKWLPSTLSQEPHPRPSGANSHRSSPNGTVFPNLPSLKPPQAKTQVEYITEAVQLLKDTCSREASVKKSLGTASCTPPRGRFPGTREAALRRNDVSPISE